MPGQRCCLLSHLPSSQKPSVLSPSQICLCQSDTKTVLPKPRSCHVSALLKIPPQLPFSPCPLIPPHVSGLQLYRGPGRSLSHPLAHDSWLLHMPDLSLQCPSSPSLPGEPWAASSDSGQGTLLWASLTAPHAESGLVCTLLSSHEALTTGVCLLAFLPHPGHSSREGHGAVHLPPSEPGTEQMLGTCTPSSELSEAGFGECEPESTTFSPPGCWLVPPGTLLCPMALPTGLVLCICAHSLPTRMTVSGWTSRRKVRRGPRQWCWVKRLVEEVAQRE